MVIDSMFAALSQERFGLSRAAACALAELPPGWAYRRRRTVSWDSYMALKRVFVALTTGTEAIKARLRNRIRKADYWTDGN